MTWIVKFDEVRVGIQKIDESKPISEWSRYAKLNMWRALWSK